MNENINLKVKGRFHLKEANRVIDNGITDWGMSRLAGHVQHKCFAVAENFYYLFLGKSQSPTDPTGKHNYTLISPIYEKTYNPTGTIEVIHNPTNTTTDFEMLPTGDMIVRFKQAFRVYFRVDTAIGELGVGPSYYKSGGADTNTTSNPTPVGFSGPGSWPRTESVGCVGYPTTRPSEYGSSISVDSSSRTNHTDTAEHAIFSRAIVPGPVAKYNGGSKEDIVYECEITVAKEAVGFLNDVVLNTSGITTPVTADQLPNNKTFIAQCPFFMLNGARYPQTLIDNKLRRLQFTGVVGSGDQQWGAFGNRQPIVPTFESCAASTATSTEARGVWMLDFYSAGMAATTIGTYDTLVPSMSTRPWNITDSLNNVIDFPCTAEMLFVRNVQNNTRSALLTLSPAKFLRVSTPSSNTWQTTLTFQFASDSFTDSVNSFQLWRAIDNNKQVKDDWKGYAGIYTALKDAWRPPTGRVIELNYTLVWQR